MLDLEWAANIPVTVAPEDVDQGGRLKAEACSLWAIMALEAAAREGAESARLVSLSVEMGPVAPGAGVEIEVTAEVTKRSRTLAFVSARAEDGDGRLLFSATGVFGLGG